MFGRFNVLPEEKVPETRRKDLGLVLIVMLILVLGVNQWYRSPDLKNWGWHIIRLKWEMLENMQHEPDWVILGDSSGGQGVVPAILEQRLDGTCLNLCTIGDMTLVNDAWMLDAMIQQGTAPRNVLLVHVYDILDRDDEALLTNLNAIDSDFSRIRALNPVPNITLSTQKIFHGAEWFPLYFRNSTLAKWIKSPWKIDVDQNDRRRETVTDKGFFANAGTNPSWVKKETEKKLAEIETSTAFISDINMEALGRMQDLCAQNNINIFWAWSPVYRGLAAEAAFQKHLSELEACLGQYPDIRLLTNFPREFDAAEMESVDHVNPAAAERYTESLARAIQEAGGI